MSEEPRDAFERDLEDLGPLMADQELYLEHAPDAEFARSLRNRLTGTAVPVARKRRASRVRLGWLAGGVSGGLAAAAIALVLLLQSPSERPEHQASFPVPIPGQAAILRTYPAGGLGAGGPPVPWISTFSQPEGLPYLGKVRLRASALGSEPTRSPAFELEGPTFDLPRLRAIAGRLGISGPTRHATLGGERWIYIAEYPGGSAVHSVAISLSTGELIYHDSSLPGPALAAPAPAQTRAARRWLSRLGWPGQTMPRHLPLTTYEKNLIWTVQLGWPDVGAAVPAAATLSVTSGGQVVEAQVYPPVARRGTVPIRSPRAAWHDVQDGASPIAVPALTGMKRAGHGTQTETEVIQILTAGSQGRLYLAPAYHFAGSAHFPNAGRVAWYAVVPAQKAG